MFSGGKRLTDASAAVSNTPELSGGSNAEIVSWNNNKAILDLRLSSLNPANPLFRGH